MILTRDFRESAEKFLKTISALFDYGDYQRLQRLFSSRLNRCNLNLITVIKRLLHDLGFFQQSLRYRLWSMRIYPPSQKTTPQLAGLDECEEKTVSADVTIWACQRRVEADNPAVSFAKQNWRGKYRYHSRQRRGGVVFHLVIGACLLMIPFSKSYAEVSVKAEVDKIKISLDDALTYKLTITSDEKGGFTPQSPKFEGFNIVSQAQSSSVSFLNSQMKTTFTYIFVLSAANTGKFKIEPSVIKIKDKPISTESFEIEVTEGKIKPKAPSLEIEQPQITL